MGWFGQLAGKFREQTQDLLAMELPIPQPHHPQQLAMIMLVEQENKNTLLDMMVEMAKTAH